jgi:hypothetical protein
MQHAFFAKKTTLQISSDRERRINGHFLRLFTIVVISGISLVLIVYVNTYADIDKHTRSESGRPGAHRGRKIRSNNHDEKSQTQNTEVNAFSFMKSIHLKSSASSCHGLPGLFSIINELTH